MALMVSGENEIDRQEKKKKQSKGEGQGTAKISHPALAGLKEGDKVTISATVVKPGETSTVEIMDVQPEENKADEAMNQMMGKDRQAQGGMAPQGAGDEF